MTTYPKLFDPIRIGRVAIKNRIAMAPMGIEGLLNPDGNPAQRAYLHRFALGKERGGGRIQWLSTAVW